MLVARRASHPFTHAASSETVSCCAGAPPAPMVRGLIDGDPIQPVLSPDSPQTAHVFCNFQERLLCDVSRLLGGRRGPLCEIEDDRW